MNEQTIFISAIERDSALRPAFLDQVCGSDLVLRRRVEQLLALHECGNSLLEHPAACVAETLGEPVRERPGTQIGPYNLREQIGEGGMGVVYLAEQMEPVRRKVALKVIKPGMDTRQVVARFEAERQALAMMNHPNIARVLDAGATEAGRPYFVMELVRGLPITEFCDQHQLTTRERLALFITVCQAVQHAHQKGLIHRDLKPSNVLVEMHDVIPMPKVIDFGVAKAIGHSLTEKTLYTAFSQLVGTPLYMSPEQAGQSSIDVDTRSDIYSLGVLLYELLTGSTPFDRDTLKKVGFDEMRRMIREVDPPRPSARVSTLHNQALSTVSDRRQVDPRKLRLQLRGELDWIVMKALEKGRTRRYETAIGFAADVQRYLDDEPVQACPPSASYRFLKIARRNKVALAVAGMVMFFLVLLGSGAGWAVRDRAAREAELTQERTERQARFAVQVELIMDEADRWQQEQKWPEALAAAKRAEALTAGAEGDAELEQRVEQLLADLQMVRRLEEIRLQRSQLTEDERSFDYRGADRAYATAFREYGIDVDGLPAAAADRIRSRPGVAVALTAALDDWASCLRRSNNDVGADALAEIAQAADADPWRRRVRTALGQKDMKSLESLELLAISTEMPLQPPQTLLMLAQGLSNDLQQLSREVLRQGQQAHPDDFWLNYALALEYRFAEPPQLGETIRFNSIALALNPDAYVVRNNLGAALSDAGRLEEAVVILQQAIALAPAFSNAHYNLAIALDARGDRAKAIAAYQRAIALNSKFTKAYGNLGAILYGEGKFDEALAAFQNAIDADADYAPAHHGLGNALVAKGRVDEAIAAYQQAIALDPEDALAHSNLSNILQRKGRLDKAIAAGEQAIALDPKYALAHITLGTALHSKGRLDEAIAAYKQAIALDPKYALTYSKLGAALLDKGLVDEAIAAFQQAVTLVPNDTNTHNNLGAALLANGLVDEAIAAFQQAMHYGAGDWKAAITALENSMELGNGGGAIDRFFLAMAHWQLDQKEEARKWYDQAVQWMEKHQPNNDELRRLQLETEQLLGVPKTADDSQPKTLDAEERPAR